MVCMWCILTKLLYCSRSGRINKINNNGNKLYILIQWQALYQNAKFGTYDLSKVLNCDNNKINDGRNGRNGQQQQ